MTQAMGDIFEGDWEDDEKVFGVHSATSHVVYTGEFAKTKVRNGKGKVTYPNGDVYEGTFENDKRTGPGKYTYVPYLLVAWGCFCGFFLK